MNNKINHSKITVQIIQYCKDNINSGVWRVGEKIPSENQLSDMLGVSRSSIRSAIQYLTGLGVLETRHGKGTYLLDNQVDENTGSDGKITSEDCKDIQKVLEFRRIVETEACYLATNNVSENLLLELKECLKIMMDNEGKRDAFVAADMHFHALICCASDNPILEKTVLKVFEETMKNHKQMNTMFGYKDGIYYHKKILEAMESGDADKAKEYMYEHLQNAIDKIERDEGVQYAQK